MDEGLEDSTSFSCFFTTQLLSTVNHEITGCLPIESATLRKFIKKTLEQKKDGRQSFDIKRLKMLL